MKKIALALLLISGLSACVTVVDEARHEHHQHAHHYVHHEHVYHHSHAQPHHRPVEQAPRQQPNLHRNAQGQVIKTHDGRCIDFSQSDKRSMLAYACHGKANQRITFNQRSGTLVVQGKCLDVAGAQQHNGAPVIAYQCNGQRNQQWYMQGNRIRSAHSGKCLDIYNGKMVIHQCNGNRGQQFYWQR